LPPQQQIKIIKIIIQMQQSSPKPNPPHPHPLFSGILFTPFTCTNYLATTIVVTSAAIATAEK